MIKITIKIYNKSLQLKLQYHEIHQMLNTENT